MASKTIELLMSNIAKDPVDLVHQVTAYPGSVWASPYKQAKSILDQTNNYRKYSHYLANALFLKADPQSQAYDRLLQRAIDLKKLVFECTCYPGPCHLDALRIQLTKDLEAMGYTIKSNQVNVFGRHHPDED